MSKKQGYIVRVSRFLEENPSATKEEIRAAFAQEMKAADNGVYQLATKYHKLYEFAACNGYSYEFIGNEAVRTATKLTDDQVAVCERRSNWLKKVAKLFNESARLDGAGPGAKKFDMLDFI